MGSDAARRQPLPPVLTGREQQVLARLVAGDTNREIGAHLGISTKTVMHHTCSIYRKLRVRGRPGAVAWAVQRSELR